MRKSLQVLLPTLLAVAVMVIAMVGINGGPAAMAVGETRVTIDGQVRDLTGIDIRRTTDALVLYTKSGTRTGTNQYGTEVAVVNGVVTQVQTSVGNMLIPANGYVLSGHGTSNTWLRQRAQVGDAVLLNGNSPSSSPPTTNPTSPTSPPTTVPPGVPKLPDIGIRTLRQFAIAYPTTGAFAGRKLLKFPAVTANVGDGPLEIRAVRSTSSSTDWVGSQIVRTSDGQMTALPPSPSARFNFGGDGHNHWHITDFDSYELLTISGQQLELGEKHGFCFEDNTSYRDWPSTGKNGTPRNPVYVPPEICNVGQPQATSIKHGLSVGWADTYPASLPDQAIDITGIADGEYMVRVTADWQHLWAEKNESNNSATARIRISGSTVTLLSATDGL